MMRLSGALPAGEFLSEEPFPPERAQEGRKKDRTPDKQKNNKQKTVFFADGEKRE
jgi:hypothetical protein